MANLFYSYQGKTHQTKFERSVTMRKIICFVLAALFFALGIVGIIFPVIPQVPFLIMGILFLAAASTRFKHFLTETEFYKKYLKEHVDKNETLSKFMNE